MRSNGPVILALPAFRGVTRRLVLLAGGLYLVLMVLGVVYPPLSQGATMMLILTPHLAVFGHPWQVATFALFSGGFLNTVFALLSIWFSGSMLQDERGDRWVGEYVVVAAVGGGVVATALSLVGLPGISSYNSALGLWAIALALLLAIARVQPQAEFGLMFLPMRFKAKYFAAGFLGLNLLMSLLAHDYFGALTTVCVVASGLVYLQLAPRRGLGFAFSENMYGMRNAYYRAKRRRAAKKFTVYMRKQGKEVNIDPSGRYVDPDGKPREPRDPNDTRWMN